MPPWHGDASATVAQNHRPEGDPTVADPQTPADASADPLSYGSYADSLWRRIELALNKDRDGKAALGDDPLVVGVFGEWGAGKSHLLKLLQKKAEAQTVQDIANRALHFEEEKSIPLTVTVPVWFQPWKYEHEPHLHVPLAMHIADALEDA